jgi:imidazole glycerol-phosphate synthase subunit HisH
MLALIDYGSGNLRSAQKALLVAGAGDVSVTADPHVIAKADRIVLPGVGAFADCIENLNACEGLREVLEQRVRMDGTPFLGICVGMQLMADVGIEFGATDGLGWIAGKTSVVLPGDPSLKVPHMGWNTAEPTGISAAFDVWNGPQDAYFVHSFAYRAADDADVAAWCTYGSDRFAAAVSKDNMLGLQFHPEKSQRAGVMLLESWLKS